MADKTFQLAVVTPEASVLETEATFAAVPAHDGEIGFLRDRRVGQCDPGYGKSERGAADIVQACLGKEGNGGRVAPVLAANPHLEGWFRLPAQIGAHGDQLANPRAVQAREWIRRENSLLDVGGQEPSRIVAGKAHSCLG